MTDSLSVRHMNELFSIHHHISLVGEAWRFLHQVRVACDNQWKFLLDSPLTEHRLGKLFDFFDLDCSIFFSPIFSASGWKVHGARTLLWSRWDSLILRLTPASSFTSYFAHFSRIDTFPYFAVSIVFVRQENPDFTSGRLRFTCYSKLDWTPCLSIALCWRGELSGNWDSN